MKIVSQNSGLNILLFEYYDPETLFYKICLHKILYFYLLKEIGLFKYLKHLNVLIF